jgi:CDP-glucose 4,6-dehydratase
MNCPHLPLTVQNQASNEIPKQYLDCTKARERLGWGPAWSLDDSLVETVGWYREWFARGQRNRASAETLSAR